MDNDECSALNKDIPSKEMEELEDKNAISWEMHSHYKKKSFTTYINFYTGSAQEWAYLHVRQGWEKSSGDLPLTSELFATNRVKERKIHCLPL